MSQDARAVVLALVCGAAIGALGGYWLRGTDMPVPERIAPAEQQRQGDGSVVAGQAPPPMAPPLLPGLPAKPKPPRHQLPKGSVEERRMEVVVQPQQPGSAPVQVDLSLVRIGDTRRIVASSPDGTVLRALDMPIDAAMVPPPRRPWAAGASFGRDLQPIGIWVERDFARLRVGADLTKEERGDLRVLARIGIRF